MDYKGNTVESKQHISADPSGRDVNVRNQSNSGDPTLDIRNGNFHLKFRYTETPDF
jgi:hypothetical protein